MSYLNEVAKIAPIATATIAGVALIIALASIFVQRGLARRRAALDFFFKTEMDKSTVDAYNSYESAIEKFKKHGSAKALYDDDAEYRSVRAYLNIHELVAVGIHTGVLDEKVCYNFWSDELIEAFEDSKSLIDYIRSMGSVFSYTEFEKLSKKWTKRDESEKRKLKGELREIIGRVGHQRAK
jgi:hypothetical protein